MVDLLAAGAGLGELLLVAGAAVDVVVFAQEALGADGLLTLITGEALIMKRVSFILHTLHTCSTWKHTHPDQSGSLRLVLFVTEFSPVLF